MKKHFVLWICLTLPSLAMALPANFQLELQADQHLEEIEAAFQSLPPRLRDELEQTERVIKIYMEAGELRGLAQSRDQMGELLPEFTVYLRWPADQEVVTYRWGENTLVHALRHEMAHIGLDLLFYGRSKIWVDIIKVLRTEGPEFLQQVIWGHQDAENLYSYSSIAHFASLHEYLASLIEFCGEETRMPLPRGAARPLVESLVVGGVCQ